MTESDCISLKPQEREVILSGGREGNWADMNGNEKGDREPILHGLSDLLDLLSTY